MPRHLLYTSFFSLLIVAGVQFLTPQAQVLNATEEIAPVSAAEPTAKLESQIFRKPDRPDIIPGDYIVVFKDSVSDAVKTSDEFVGKNKARIKHQYTEGLRGFSASLSTTELEKIKRDPRVEFVSEDRTVYGAAQIVPTGVPRIGIATPKTGKATGVGIAVLDTGIDLTHPELKNNIIAKKSCISGNSTGNDDNGHGSHVAGTIGALNNDSGSVGIISDASLIAVKVLNKDNWGTWSQIICGIDWVTSNAKKYNIKVANMSIIGSGTSDNNCGKSNNDALHKAICKSVAAGVTYVVAAGNEGEIVTGKHVPAAYDDTVITVSALADSDGAPNALGTATPFGADDTFADFSNFGPEVDIAAPGVAIYSTFMNGGYATYRGTSMATPHVAAAAAIYIKQNPGKTWKQVRDALKAMSEPVNQGHTDPSGKHSEPVLRVTGMY